MINLHFRVPPYFLAYCVVKATRPNHFRSGKLDPSFVALQGQAKKQDHAAFHFIENSPWPMTFFTQDAIENETLCQEATRADSLLERLQKTDGFQTMLNSTGESLVKIRHDWEESLPKMQSFGDKLCDPSKPHEITVFVMPSSLDQSDISFGDIYMTDRPPQDAAGNCLYLWCSVAEVILKSINPENKNDGDHIWVSRLISRLCAEEIQSVFQPGRAMAISEDDNDKIFLIDLELLRPQFKDFIKQDQPDKTMADFQIEANQFMMNEWKKRMARRKAEASSKS